MAEHNFYSADKDYGEYESEWFQTNIIQGGLSLCKDCGALEGALTTDCPGEKVPIATQDDVYYGKLDYINGKWLVGVLNPTNKSWMYGRYIRYYDSDIKFAEQNKISYEYFLEIKEEWIAKAGTEDLKI